MGSLRPPLKAGIDLQLQSAYDEGNWTIVARLAEKRARMKDQHAEVLKVCAEAQLGSPVEKCAAVVYASNAFKSGTVIKDVESMHLLDWACLDMTPDSFFREVLGPLRVRLVKANSKDRRSVVNCLEDCLLRWDLNSAQQIAAILDRAFPQVHQFLFWNIVITYMLSASDQCAQDKKFLYRELSAKQALKAVQVTEQALSGEDKTPTRGIKSEEEILLLFDMLESKSDIATWKGFIDSPVLGPLRLFEKGQKDLLLRTISVFALFNEWKSLYSLIKDCLVHQDENGRQSLLASDWTVWRAFIQAASHERDTRIEVTEQVFELIESHLSADKTPPIYRRTLLLARVQACFELGTGIRPPTSLQPKESARLLELLKYVDDQYSSTSCFEDIRGFVEKLNGDEFGHLLFERLTQMTNESSGYKQLALKTLACKLRYLATCMPQSGLLKTKGTEVLADVAADALGVYHVLAKSLPSEDETARAQQDFLADLAMVAAMCFIKMSGMASSQGAVGSNTHRCLLLAAAILEHHLLLSPKHSGILLLLARLYLRLGVSRRAVGLWELLEVKRTIVDSLSPIFFDRISGIDPGLASGPMLSDVVQSHYVNSLRLRMPRRLTDAFEEEAYTSILEIPKYITGLRTSCTMAMGYLEQKRAVRAVGIKLGEPDDTALDEVTDETILSRATDYGSFPNYESELTPPMQDILSIGPSPSNSRSHLALLAEQYFAVLSFKALGTHKPATPSVTASTDHAFVVESLHQLAVSFGKFLNRPDGLTPHEKMLYTILSLLPTIIVESAQATRSGPAAGSLQEYISSVTSSLDFLLDMTVGAITCESSTDCTISTMSSLHGISCIRDAAAAAKLAATYINGFNDRQREKDRSGASCLRKDVAAGIKSLDTTATETLKEAEGWISAASREAGPPVFVEKLKALVAQAEEVDGVQNRLEQAVAKVLRSEGDGEVNVWVKKVADGWRQNLNGWEHVKWE